MSRSDDDHDFEPRGRIRSVQVIVIVLLVVGLLVAIFVIQNTESANIEFLWLQGRVSLAGALLLAAALGGIFGFLVTYLRQRQFRQAMRREHRAHEEGREPRAEPGLDEPRR
jgi:lipopolysaccharide assembly protein A